MMSSTQLIEILVNFSKNIPFSLPLPGRGHLTVPRLEIGLWKHCVSIEVLLVNSLTLFNFQF